MSKHNRPGRPAGPTDGRGDKPYDPRRSTSRRERIIRSVADHERELREGNLTLGALAERLGTSPSYFSVTKNSKWGQQRLRELRGD